jgi:hypothetical protein
MAATRCSICSNVLWNSSFERPTGSRTGAADETLARLACASSMVRSGRRSREAPTWASSSASSVMRKARSLAAPPSTTAAARWKVSKPIARSADSSAPVTSGRARCAERSTRKIRAAHTALLSAGAGPRSSVPTESTATGTSLVYRRNISAENGLRARFPVQMKTTWNSPGDAAPNGVSEPTVADDSESVRQAPCRKCRIPRRMSA